MALKAMYSNFCEMLILRTINQVGLMEILVMFREFFFFFLIMSIKARAKAFSNCCSIQNNKPSLKEY